MGAAAPIMGIFMGPSIKTFADHIATLMLLEVGKKQ